MKTIEKMKHVRKFDSCDVRKLSDYARDVYSCSDCSIYVRGIHSYEWVGSNCIEEFGELFEVHSNSSIHSDIVFESDSIDDVSGYFEGLLS